MKPRNRNKRLAFPEAARLSAVWIKGMLAFLFTCLPSFAQGDTYVATLPGSEGHVSEIVDPQRQEIIDDAKAVDPTRGAALEAAVCCGDVKIVKLFARIDGCHDHNTIAIGHHVPSCAQGIVALHEFEHIQNTNPGDIGDSRVSDPCYVCTHAHMNATSALQLKELISSKPNMATWLRDTLCEVLQSTMDAASPAFSARCVGPCALQTGPPPVSLLDPCTCGSVTLPSGN